MLTVGLIILVVAIQMALIGETALALGQVNYQGARYAALHQCATAADVAAYMTSVASPTLSGGNCGAGMAVTLTDINGSSSASGSCGTPRMRGDAADLRQPGFSSRRLYDPALADVSPQPFPRHLFSGHALKYGGGPLRMICAA